MKSPTIDGRVPLKIGIPQWITCIITSRDWSVKHKTEALAQ